MKDETPVPAFIDRDGEYTPPLSDRERATKFGEAIAKGLSQIGKPVPAGLEPVAWSVTMDGLHTGNFKTDEYSAVWMMTRLNESHPTNSRTVVPLYAAPVITEPAVPTGCKLVGWLDGRDRFFYADDPMYKNRHDGMREVFAAAPEVKS